eukprot:symbB.v1.2.015127.t1/scaffold1122.1/size136700/11
MGGLISGKQQEAVQKAESDLAVLRDELMMKIQENEELHMRVFEAQKQHNEEAERLRDTEASRGRDLERYSAQLKSSKEEVERLGIENKRMVERIGTLDHQLSASAQLSESLREQLDKERAESLSTKQALQRRFTRWVPFDWTQHDLWTGFSMSSHQGRIAKQRQQALQDLYSAVQEACRHCCGALQTWPSVLIGGAEEESAAQLRVRVKVADVAKDLAGCITRVVPPMAEMFGKGGLVDDQRQELRRYSNELVMIHRRWVLYQSVLLHHWQSTSGRSSQEEALAQSFVDCLWRLHRCVRSLIARLRVATLLPDLSTGNSSAAHFALARRKLSRKGGGAVDQKPPGIQAAERLGLVQRSLSDVSHCWKALGRCLSSWAAAQAGGSTVTTSSNTSQASGGGVVGLLGCIHGLCACLNERVLPMVEKLAMQAPGPHEMPLLLSTHRVGGMAFALGRLKFRCLTPGSTWMQSFRAASGWASPGHGMYGEPGPDPTNGRSRWHAKDGPFWKQQERPPYGAKNTQEYDEQHGRWWWQKKEVWRPKLYTTIGKHARSPKLSRTILRWAGNTPNFRKLKRDMYRKRWPKPEQLNYKLFAEFCLKEFKKRTLLETAHTLPLYGEGCKFWRAPDETHAETKGQYFVAEKIEYRQRPFRGDFVDVKKGIPVRDGIAPIAKSLGSWRYQAPENAHPLVYRPPFPGARTDSTTAASVTDEAE